MHLLSTCWKRLKHFLFFDIFRGKESVKEPRNPWKIRPLNFGFSLQIFWNIEKNLKSIPAISFSPTNEYVVYFWVAYAHEAPNFGDYTITTTARFN